MLLDDFNTFHNITTPIVLPFKEENGILYVVYKSKDWAVSYIRGGISSFYTKSVLKLKKKFGVELLRALKLEPEKIKIKPKNKKEKSKPISDGPLKNMVYNRESIENEILNELADVNPIDPMFNSPILEDLPAPLEPSNTAMYLKLTKYTFGKFLKSYEMVVLENRNDPVAFLEEVESITATRIAREAAELNGVKFNLVLQISMRKDNPQTNNSTYTHPSFYSAQIPVLKKVDIDEDNIKLNLVNIDLAQAHAKIIASIENYVSLGSGWVVDRIERLFLNFADYSPLRGGSYIPLPKKLANKKVIINVQNQDDNCLRWALRSALFPTNDHSNRTSSYPTNDGLNFTGIEFPTPLTQIKKVEKQNNLAINVYGWEKGCTVNYYISSQPSEIPRICLMLLTEKLKDNEEEFEWGEDTKANLHYTWIKNLNGLLYDQTLHKEKKYFCDRCHHGYTRADLLEEHKPECRGNGERSIKIEMPTEKKSI